jgi:Bacteriodetes cell division protein (FtsL-like)
MAQNTFRTRKTVARQKRKSRLTTWVNNVIGLDRLFGQNSGWIERNIVRIFWTAFLMVIYIGLNHNAERLVRRIQRAKTEVDEARAQYTTLQAEFLKSGKQSELSKRVAPLGLGDSQTPPRKLVLKEEDL